MEVGKRIFSKGFRTDNLLPDRHMPLIAFAPDNTLDLIHRKRDKMFWQSYDVERGNGRRWSLKEYKTSMTLLCQRQRSATVGYAKWAKQYSVL